MSVILEANETEVRLIVEDDGKGFDPQEMSSRSISSLRLGLLGIRERLSLINGHLEVESDCGKGTTLIVTVPL